MVGWQPLVSIRFHMESTLQNPRGGVCSNIKVVMEVRDGGGKPLSRQIVGGTLRLLERRGFGCASKCRDQIGLMNIIKSRSFSEAHRRVIAPILEPVE